MNIRPTPAPARDSQGLFTTAQAAHIILGGTDTEGYWGFTFGAFLEQYQERLASEIGSPLRAPWRGLVEFTTQDYLDLCAAVDSMDFVANPADLLDESMALEFVRRSDVLGLNGPIGCGKDTAAEALEPHGFTRMSFADPLRVAGAMTYGVPLRYFTDRQLKESPLPGSKMTPRRVLQLMGTEVCRVIHESLWVKRMLLRSASAMHDLAGYSRNHPERISASGGVKVVIADVRFQNEADFVRSVGGRVVRIARPQLSEELAKTVNGNGHVSEAGVSQHPTDILLVNVGSKDYFQSTVAETLVDTNPAIERRMSSSRGMRMRA